MRISAEQVQEIERSTFQELANQLEALRGDEHLWLQKISSQLSAPMVDDAEAMRIYFTVLAILRKIRSRDILRDQDLKRLLQIAETSLKICKIKPVTSRWSHLYRDLHEELARQHLSRQSTWLSIAASDVAAYLGRDSQKSSSSQSILHRGLQSWQLGCIRMAKLAFHYLEQVRHDPHEMIIARIYLIRCYRLSSDLEQIRYLITTAKAENPTNLAWQSHLETESVLLEVQQDNAFEHLHRHLLKNATKLSALNLARCQLWLLASSKRDVASSLKLSRNNRSDEIDEILGTPRDFCRNLVKVIVDCYNPSSPLHLRLELLGKKLQDLSALTDPELSLLFYAAAIRWLYRSRQYSFAKLLIECYQERCLQYSQGHIRDSLQLIDKIYESIPELPSQFNPETPNRLFAGKVPRFLKLSKVIAKSSYYIARYQLKPNKTLDDFVKMQHAIILQILQSIHDSMGTLRGPMLKIGQYLGVTQIWSPEIQSLAKSIFNQPALFSLDELIHHASQEAGRDLQSHFQSIEPDTIGVASIGQVYTALTHDNEPVAVKLKYPDIDRIIRSDLSFMRILTPILRQAMPNTHIGRIWQHFEHRFANECDYSKELEYQQRFAEIFANDPHIHIPKVYAEASCKSMFVSELIEGERLDRFLQTASDEEREQVAFQMLYFFIKTTLGHGLWHIDPHPANFIVTDNKLAVLDFGAIHEATEHSIQIHFALAESRQKRDIGLLYDTFVKLKVLNPKIVTKEIFSNGLGYDFLVPFHIDEIRPFYIDGEMGVGYTIISKGYNHAFVVNADDFFSLVVSDYFGDLLSKFGLTINWHQLYCRCLAEAKPNPKLIESCEQPAHEDQRDSHH